MYFTEGISLDIISHVRKLIKKAYKMTSISFGGTLQCDKDCQLWPIGWHVLYIGLNWFVSGWPDPRTASEYWIFKTLDVFMLIQRVQWQLIFWSRFRWQLSIPQSYNNYKLNWDRNKLHHSMPGWGGRSTVMHARAPPLCGAHDNQLGCEEEE